MSLGKITWLSFSPSKATLDADLRETFTRVRTKPRSFDSVLRRLLSGTVDIRYVVLRSTEPEGHNKRMLFWMNEKWIIQIDEATFL